MIHAGGYYQCPSHDERVATFSVLVNPKVQPQDIWLLSSAAQDILFLTSCTAAFHSVTLSSSEEISEDSTKCKNRASQCSRKKEINKQTGLGKYGIVAELQCKKRIYRRWKQGWATQEEFTNIAWACRNGVRKVKAQLEFYLSCQ